MNRIVMQASSQTSGRLRMLDIRHFINITFVIPGLTRNPARINIGAHCAPLDTGLRRYDGATFYMPDL
jgi:hypothetical protein